MQRRLIAFLVVISMLAVATLSCGLGSRGKELLGIKDNSSTDAQPTQREEIEPQSSEATQDETRPTENTEQEPFPDETEPPKATPENVTLISGLDQLDSYRLNMTIKTSEKDADGKTIEKSVGILMEMNSSTGDEHTLMKLSDDSGDPSTQSLSNLEMYTVSGTTYILFPGEDGAVSCMSSAADDNSTADISAGVNEIFGSMENLRLIKKDEMVNSVKTDHYTFDEKNLKNTQMTKAKGDVWIAQGGGFIVKMTATGTGTDTLENNEDKIVDYDLYYSLEDVNQTVSITVPDACQQGLPDDIPMPASATLDMSMEGFYSLKSTESGAVVADFYRKALPGKGWEINSDSSLDTLFTLEFSKDGKSYSMMITSSDTGCDILITVKP